MLLWGALLLGLAALLLLPLQQREYAAERLQQELAQPRALAERAALVQQQLQQLEAGRDYLGQQQVRASAMLELLEELTRLLPDHTWLTRFEVSQERVRLEVLDNGIGMRGKAGQGVPVGVGQPHLTMNAMTLGGTRV